MAVPDILTDQIRTITDHMKKDLKNGKLKLNFPQITKLKAFKYGYCFSF